MINTENIVEKFSLMPGMKVADFGAGSGFFSVAMAKHIGKAIVYSFDVQKEALSAINSMASHQHLTNIETNRVDLESPNATGLADKTIDFILISSLLFQAEEKAVIVKEAFRVLVPGGRVAVIDWRMGAPLGPIASSRVSKESVIEIFNKEGFSLSNEFNAGENHYGLMFKKT
ncbi:class I SAM-dependent methyltransferase [Patescibacteria group bacterium]